MKPVSQANAYPVQKKAGRNAGMARRLARICCAVMV
jgi:hypothetical protein